MEMGSPWMPSSHTIHSWISAGGFFSLDRLPALNCLGVELATVLHIRHKTDRPNDLSVFDFCRSYAAGNTTLNVEPCPTPSDSAQIFPPCASINPFAIVRPMPSPL